jgi:hypothetical protein
MLIVMSNQPGILRLAKADHRYRLGEPVTYRITDGVMRTAVPDVPPLVPDREFPVVTSPTTLIPACVAFVQGLLSRHWC